MQRREFMTVLGGASVACPVAARAQQSAMPVVGYLSVGSPIEHLLGVFKQSMAEAGFVEGRNVVIEPPSADGRYERLPTLAADLVRRQVTVIVAAFKPFKSARSFALSSPMETTEQVPFRGLARRRARRGGVSLSVSRAARKHRSRCDRAPA
jgi:hypothetical protein